MMGGRILRALDRILLDWRVALALAWLNAVFVFVAREPWRKVLAGVASATVFYSMWCRVWIVYRPSLNRLGVDFRYHGDTVIWVWPWQRTSRGKYISILLSGNGSCGDMWFNSLAEIDACWACIHRLEMWRMQLAGPAEAPPKGLHD